MRRAKGSIYRPSGKLKNGKRTKTPFYWVRYRDAHGKRQCHALKLPNGDRITDQEVAESEFRKILKRVEREAAGLVDHEIENALIPMRVVIARYIRYLRKARRSQQHIATTLSYLKAVLGWGGIERLVDFNEQRIDLAIGQADNGTRSARTVNMYRGCCHSLATWAISKKVRLLKANPVSEIVRLDEKLDARRVRRSLTVEEAYRLLAVCGPRRLFYSIQLWTGLRVSETRALEWRDLQLDGNRPSIQLRAATTKAKRADEVPLYPDLAGMLTKTKPLFSKPTDRIFASVPILRTFKLDLRRARIPFEDVQGRTVDRHAMRTTFVSWLGLYGVDPRAQIMLARHSPQGITMRHYQDFSLFDLWSEIAKLPSIHNDTTSQPDSIRATGTDSAVVRPVVLKVGRKGVKRSAVGRIDSKVSSECHIEKTLQNKGKTAITASKTHSGREDLNLRLLDPQSSALTRLRHAPCMKTLTTDDIVREKPY